MRSISTSEAPRCLCEEVLDGEGPWMKKPIAATRSGTGSWTRGEATTKQFEAYLRLIYNRPDMLARFPHGF